MLLRLVKQVRYTYNEKKEKLACNAKLQLLQPRDDRQKWLPHSYTKAVGNYKLRVRMTSTSKNSIYVPAFKRCATSLWLK
jgi:hypothetical protein